jgi:hypothetical protein
VGWYSWSGNQGETRTFYTLILSTLTLETGNPGTECLPPTVPLVVGSSRGPTEQGPTPSTTPAGFQHGCTTPRQVSGQAKWSKKRQSAREKMGYIARPVFQSAHREGFARDNLEVLANLPGFKRGTGTPACAPCMECISPGHRQECLCHPQEPGAARRETRARPRSPLRERRHRHFGGRLPPESRTGMWPAPYRCLNLRGKAGSPEVGVAKRWG